MASHKLEIYVKIPKFLNPLAKWHLISKAVHFASYIFRDLRYAVFPRIRDAPRLIVSLE